MNSLSCHEGNRGVGVDLVLLRFRFRFVLLIDVLDGAFAGELARQIITRMKRLFLSDAACAKTASGPASYDAPPGPNDVERPWVSIRIPPSIRHRMPGPW